MCDIYIPDCVVFSENRRVSVQPPPLLLFLEMASHAPNVETVRGGGGAQRTAGQLRVTTYNLLAPVWVHPSYYPGQPVELFQPSTRRATIKNRILDMDPDVLGYWLCQQAAGQRVLAAIETHRLRKGMCRTPGRRLRAVLADMVDPWKPTGADASAGRAVQLAGSLSLSDSLLDKVRLRLNPRRRAWQKECLTHGYAI
jgi:hypothetical protein